MSINLTETSTEEKESPSRQRYRPLLFMITLGIIYVIVSATMGRMLETSSARFDLMGTVVEITVTAPRRQRPEKMIRAARERMEQIDRLLSSYKPDSVVSRLNALPPGTPLQLKDSEIGALDVFENARRMSELTDGAFDITFASAGRYWRFDPLDPRLPTPEEMGKAVKAINYHNVVIDREARTLTLLGEGTQVGLGGIAKGTAIDRAAAYLHERGAFGAMVNAGGDIYAFGYRGKEPEPSSEELRNRPWKIALRDPRQTRRILPPEGVPLEGNMAVVTSGDYERMFVIDGKRYHHILNPRTGQPAQGLISVTVFVSAKDFSPNLAEFADGLSTALFVMGTDEAPALAARFANVEAIFITSNEEMLATPGAPEAIVKAYHERQAPQDTPEPEAPPE
ncbi:FAD:protein FMN transferase [bacterium]|nr:FAD:protein FMN transferase [bacterium]